MKKMNLQLFAKATPVQGKKMVYLYRLISEASKSAGATLALTTENGRSKSKDADTTATKDGAVRNPGTIEEEITVTSLLAKGDALIAKLEASMGTDEIVEVWEANLENPAEPGPNKYKGKYFQTYLTDFEITSDSEDYAEVSLTFSVIGAGKDGDVTVTEEQRAIADYVFKDTTSSPGK